MTRGEDPEVPEGRNAPPASEAGEAAGPGEQARAEAARRRRLSEVFGDVLPETTSDERDPRGSGGRDEDWYRSNRPPHHGG